MAYQAGRKVTQPAKGNAPATGNPGPTPAPVRYANPSMAERDFTPGYGTNHAPGSSSLTPGQKMTSPLADDLKRKAADSDGGDLLQAIVEGGTARGNAARVELQSPQTRSVDSNSLPVSFGMRSRNGDTDKVPATCGAPVSAPVRKH
jgi:hypothetical protein